jgi:L-alanine-DL-glutamate epimerase-like enolase superfamily enzyme
MNNGMFVVQDVEVFIGKAPLVTPFRIATGQHNELDNVFLRLRTTDGVSGFGEAAVATHITGETVVQTLNNLKAAANLLVGREISDPLAVITEFNSCFTSNHAGLAAFEMALLDAFARTRRIPFRQLFAPPPGRRSRLSFATDITIVIGSLEEAEAAVRHYAANGFDAFKIKVGKDRDLDFQRVCAVQRIVPGSTLILDANMGFDAAGMLAFLGRLKAAGVHIALLEQPVPKGDWDGLAAVTRDVTKLGTLVCADESVGSLADAEMAITLGAVSAINIKFMKTGIMESVQIAQLACKHDIKLMLGAMMESGLAITASAHFAAALGCFDFIDLDTTFFITGPFACSPYLDTTGRFDLACSGPGIGVEPPLP